MASAEIVDRFVLSRLTLAALWCAEVLVSEVSKKRDEEW